MKLINVLKNLFNKIKNKKIMIFVVSLLIISCLVFAWFTIFNISNNWQLQISDVSKNCYSNTLNIYPNKDYAVVSGVGDRLIARGKSTYSKTLEHLTKKVNTYPADQEPSMNYKVEFKTGEIVYVDQNNSPELDNLISTIKVDNLFWCD